MLRTSLIIGERFFQGELMSVCTYNALWSSSSKSYVGPPSLNGTSKALKQENDSFSTFCKRTQGTRYPITGDLMYHYRKASHSQF